MAQSRTKGSPAAAPRLTFLGAAQNVTGSRYLLEAGGSRILVDCGLYQERTCWRATGPLPRPPASIDTLLLTHAHVDHCGYLPRLVHDGFHGRVVSTPVTAEVAAIVLMDSANSRSRMPATRGSATRGKSAPGRTRKCRSTTWTT